MSKFPNVKVELVGQDGNAFAIMGRAINAARKAGVSKEDIEQYRQEAMSGDYNHLLVTTMDYFDCDGEEETDEWDDEDMWNKEDWDDDDEEWDDDES